ncbi:MAG: hypothetical protein P8Z79_06785 [Sedimentisphaerales bacterium]
MNSVKHNKEGITKREFIGFFLIGIALIHLVTFPIQGAVFTTRDLEGNWEIHMLTSGDYPQWTGWMYGTVNIDTSGNGRFLSIKRSDGNSVLPEDLIVAISPTGLITVTGMDFYGVINSQKDMIIGVNSDGGGGYAMVIFTKHGISTYTASDLEGTWYLNALESGDAPQSPGWTHAIMTMNKSGSYVMSSYLNSRGETDAGENGTADISSDGIITISGRPSAHGVINPGKDMLVLTMDGSNGGYDMSVMSKQEPSTFTTSDLKGSWEFLALTSGDYPQHIGFAHGKQTIDADGNWSFTSMTRSNGDSILPEDLTVLISPSGVVTYTGTDFHGIMNLRKDIIVGVMTDGGDGYDMLISARGARMIYSFASCSATSTNKYNPCAVGYSWIYDGFGEYSGYTKSVDVISIEPVCGVTCLKLRIEDPVEGVRYAWIAEDMQGNAHIFKFQYQSQPGAQIDSDDGIPNISFIADPNIGDTWSWHFDSIGKAVCEVISMDAMAGVYENCMKVKISCAVGGQIHSYYYKEGIGLVKDELWDASSGFILKISTQNSL